MDVYDFIKFSEYGEIPLNNKWLSKGLSCKTQDPRNYDGWIALDGYMPISLLKDNALLAFVSFSEGLEMNFQRCFWSMYKKMGKLSDDETDLYSISLEKTAGKIGIVQMQTHKGNSDLRNGIPYQDILMTSVKKLEKEFDFKTEFYISADQISWNLPFLRQKNLSKIEKNKFLKNYDRVAKRHGFEYDLESKIFFRKS